MYEWRTGNCPSAGGAGLQTLVGRPGACGRPQIARYLRGRPPFAALVVLAKRPSPFYEGQRQSWPRDGPGAGNAGTPGMAAAMTLPLQPRRAGLQAAAGAGSDQSDGSCSGGCCRPAGRALSAAASAAGPRTPHRICAALAPPRPAACSAPGVRDPALDMGAQHGGHAPDLCILLECGPLAPHCRTRSRRRAPPASTTAGGLPGGARSASFPQRLFWRYWCEACGPRAGRARRRARARRTRGGRSQLGARLESYIAASGPAMAASRLAHPAPSVARCRLSRMPAFGAAPIPEDS